MTNEIKDLKGKDRKVEEILEDDNNSSINDFSNLQIINFNENKDLIIKSFTDKIEKEICQAELDYFYSPVGINNKFIGCMPIISNLAYLVNNSVDAINAKNGNISDRKTLMIRDKVINSLENTINELGVVLKKNRGYY